MCWYLLPVYRGGFSKTFFFFLAFFVFLLSSRGTVGKFLLQPDIVLRVDVHVYVRWSSLRGCLLSSVALVSCLCGF